MGKMTRWAIVKHANWWSTLYINFKVLPFHQARHLPIVIFGKCELLIHPGCIDIEQNDYFQFGMIRIGNNWSCMHGWNTHPLQTRLEIKGRMTFKGRCFIGNGTAIYVETNAHVTFGERTYFGSQVKIASFKEIYIDDYSRFPWESQIFDTNFHYIADEYGNVHNNVKSIYVGKYCWVGNRCTIMHGSKIADWSIIASNSLVNKDISDVEYGVWGGSPVKLIKKGLRRVFNYQSELRLDEFFAEYPDGVKKLNDSEIAY